MIARERHLHVMNRILQYLKTSPGRGLLFNKNNKLKMQVYINADYAGLLHPPQDIACSWVEIW